MKLKRIDKALIAATLILLAYLGGTVYADLTGTEGLAIDLSSAGAGTDFTIAFDPTELLGNRTWGDGSTDTIVWTFNRATGTDPTITFNSASIGLLGLTASGVVALGDGGDNFSVASDGIDIDTSGNITNAGTIASGVVTVTGLINTSVGIDAVGAVDMDYGSGDVTDHTFDSDGTGTAEFVLKAGAIDGTEILDDTIDSDDYAAASIDNEHLANNAVDSDELAAGSIDQAHFAVDVIGQDEMADVDHGDVAWSGGSAEVQSQTVASAGTGTYYIGFFDTDSGSNLSIETDGALSFAQASGTLSATEFSGGGSGLTAVDAATGDSATSFFDTGTVEHEWGGLQADVSSYTGLIAITGADTTAEIDSLDEIEGQLADVTLIYTEAIIVAAGTDPDVDAAGEFAIDTDGADEPNSVVLRTFIGNDDQMALANSHKTLVFSVVSPDEINVWTGRVNPSQPVWYNRSGMSFTITEVYAISDTDNYDFTLFESASATDMSDDNDTSIVAVNCDDNGTECFTSDETAINHVIENEHAIIFEDTLGSAEALLVHISGWYNSDVN